MRELVNQLFPGLPAIIELRTGKQFEQLCETGELQRVLLEMYGEFGAKIVLETIKKRASST